MRPLASILAPLAVLLASQSARAQFASNVIVPQSRVVATAGATSSVSVVQITAEIDITQRVAVTALTLDLANPSGTIQEAELIVPVPDGAIVRTFDFEGKAAEPTTRVLPRGEAKATYDSLVARIRDPALLEFAGRSTVRTSVFPVPARGKQRVRLIYEHVLESDGDRIDYELPRSEMAQSAAAPWRVEARVRAIRPIATVYSPTHAFSIVRAAPDDVRLRLSSESAAEPGAIQFSFLLEGDGVNGTFYAYPDLSGATVDGGYFLLLGGVPIARDAERERSRKREVIVVLDTSGSMAGKKMEQAREAALQVISGLDDGERFNVIDYSDQVSCYAAEPVVKSDATLASVREYVKRLAAKGSTNLNGALQFALAQPHDAAQIPIVLFLTDGLPTSGVTDEVAIRDAASEGNRHQRRVFTFGVGDDVNAPLLDHIATTSRATSCYVQPTEAVEKSVSIVFSKLKGPILASPRLTVLDVDGKPADHRVSDLMPVQLADLYDGDELLLTGRYRGVEPLLLEVAGDYLGTERAFRFRLVPEKANLASSFVPRLWASRRIGFLVDTLRQSGAIPAKTSGGSAIASSAAGIAPQSAAEKEISDEIYRLSREFGVMTEYTAFLALEGTDLSADALNVSRMNEQIQSRLRGVRTGREAISQSTNTRAQVSQERLNKRNRLVDATMKEVEIAGVAQIADRAFYHRGDRWVDSRLSRADDRSPPDETVSFGTPEHEAIVARLLARGRQGIVALRGDVMIEIDGKRVLLQGPRDEKPLSSSAPAPAPPTAAPRRSAKPDQP